MIAHTDTYETFSYDVVNVILQMFIIVIVLSFVSSLLL